MTKQARQVLMECEFPESDLCKVERLVVSYTPKQIVDLVWRKDPDSKQENIDWFLPFFNGYVKKIIKICVLFDDKFWETYDMLNEFVEPFDVSLLPLINEMSEDTLRLEMAIEKSKPHINYVYKVWSGIEPINQNQEKIELPEIRKHEVRTVKFT